MGHGNQTEERREQAQNVKEQQRVAGDAQARVKTAATTETQEQKEAAPTIPAPFRLLMGRVVSNAIAAAVRLNLPDLLKDGEQHAVEDLAAQCGVEADALYRVMCCLNNDDFFVEHENRRFSLGENGQFYRTDHPMSVSTGLAQAMCGAPLAGVFDTLYDRLKTGETVERKVYGGDPLIVYWMKPENRAAFVGFHDNLSRLSIPGIVLAYKEEWCKYNVICDVCGGNDFLLAEVLKNGNPYARGILFDDAPIIELARAAQKKYGVADRVDCVAGDAFEAVPHGVDLFMLKSTIHPWGDKDAVRILKNCKDGLNRGGKILIMESVLSNAPGMADVAKYIDMIHLVHGQNGRERTEAEWHTLCDQAGLRILRIIRPMGLTPIIETEPK